MLGCCCLRFEMETRPKTGIVVGAGSRGNGYPWYAKEYPDQLQIIGVCEPRDFQRNRTVKAFDIAEKNAFKDWKDAADLERFADCVIICTPDRLHKEPAIAFAKKGYHILLEKPMAVTEADCREIVATCKENNVILSVCHVLRYIPWVKKVKEIIDSGAIGDVVNINHTEPVGFWHFAHSFVRGNWHKESYSSFSLLAKCCHDVDLICYWMSGRKCERVSSFGHLSHFHSGDKPKDAADRCLDCPAHVETTCPYSAKKLYLGFVKTGHTGWPVSVICDTPDIENVTQALRDGPYGRCVYNMDNDVVSNQVVNMQFEGGSTATLTMVAFTEGICTRQVMIYGTKGQITVKDGKRNPVCVYDFNSQQTTSHNMDDKTVCSSALSGHGGADFHTINAFVDMLHNPSSSTIETGPDATLASHVLCFAAERSRKENRTLCLNDDGVYV
ncbi:uncharacterized protein LOC127876940 isoform X12 [Dreissena polymorpha]|uniref:uncharacterized protein LOC127876940 isoform X12 n=1 Tax=Dreissena polymorpha TaxID=45954 RepID=UPI0022641188|nr:uncharacterized protein LOC127876940 isoform X12 [Dreissena polymorpha]XP_052278433.1 uncharacterized protein LOC127876940 isoform X12 [Dreissena polymorpha]XP_052278434.1 uncharacterized protein LOC127876940 isoform X12 [Dreissena polymorpha]